MRLTFSAVLLLSTAATLSGQTPARSPGTPAKRRSFSVVEATIPEMQAAMKEGRVTSREIVTQYLLRIALYNRRLNAVITVNPKALEEADERDRERAQGKLRGPLHGIPIALKDNMHTTDMPTTGGAVRSHPDEKSAGSRRDHPRQDDDDGTRELGCGRADADAGRLQRPHRIQHEPVRPTA
jgi:hypothetical protein